MSADDSAQAGKAGADGLRHLFIEERLKFLLPNWLYFPFKIHQEARRLEPELGLLREIVPPGCTAIDVGANRGLYSYALCRYAAKVEAFEPNPAMVIFTRAKARRRTRVHAVALSNRDGTAPFYIPQTRKGTHAHLIGSLGNRHQADAIVQVDVPVATLDSFGFDNVGFIKIDVEGAELDVLEGARRTIMRDRPILLAELLIQPVPDALTEIAKVESEYGYVATIRRNNEWQLARVALSDPKRPPQSQNVLFRPRENAAARG